MILRECFPCDEEREQCTLPNVKEIKCIYRRFMDDYSRQIFENRLMYSLTGDYEYIGRILANTGTGKNIGNLLDNFETIYIYGAGVRGGLLVRMFDGKNWRGFVDLNKSGTYMDYPIYSREDFEYEQGAAVLISTSYECEEILNYLIKGKKVPKDNIFVLNDYIKHASDNIYFDSKYLKNISMKNRIFMDLGCFDGKDSIKAVNYFKEDDISVYAFEPDNENYQICSSNLKRYDANVHLLKKGIGCQNAVGSFIEGGAGARFSEVGDVLAEIDTIDNIVGGQDVGFIKMDIEGYEEAAIIGGAETIRRCSPVLAVCVYHKRSDIWRIPMKILEINPGYHFYLEHYTFGWSDTVLYAVCQ